MTDITELTQMKGQKVEGSYYLAECTDCGKMYPSNKLTGGEPLFCGDYGECYCPHCNADDAAIGDCGDTAATAWNYQQDRIDALVEALEKAQTINAAAEKLVRCKGRYHSEQNYRALAALFGLTTPDLPPLDSESRTLTVKLPEVQQPIDGTGYANAAGARYYKECVIKALTAQGIKWEAE